MNHTDERIIKLARCGLSDEQIARKIGRPGDTERVLKALGRKGWGEISRACHVCGELAPFQGGAGFSCADCTARGEQR